MNIDVRKLKYSGLTSTEFEFNYIPKEDVLDCLNSAFCEQIKVYG